ncbi:AAA family ATPase [Rudanella paleaurantiibacter]|uniref:AAA family ATPase n=1 Tax=Rudanella paleaurantiibacter TaxID=2614655 RepID=A0A7J5U543_9BACT|nr:sigma 54-interacting transcriptional regulator [Rudanella paleaurantiibacter]KAB7732954.1 AAA family ATPase [Rudanella paleaurantiibacter]
MKILVSWYAYSNDFAGNEVRTDGPTYQFHQYFFEHDRHLILSSAAPDEDPRLDRLINRLLLDFPGRQIEGRGMRVADPIDMPDIKTKVEALLLGLSDADQIDLFISPGTPAMQVAWYLCHTSLSLPTRLLQTRAPQFTKTKRPELMVVNTERSAVPVSIVIREGLQTKEAKASATEYLITPALQPVYDRAAKLAQTDRVTGLIHGASGSGKEHLARYIHQQSHRSAGPFVAVNCSALGDTLLESRLFGYEKGAFTGAEKKTEGFFDAAREGTLFLDEIGDISPYMQQTLLRVLQEGEFTPVGATKARKADVRIIAATHRNLREACEAGQFRWDLLYRLSVAELHLPALAERGMTDKRALVEYFLKTKGKAFKRSKPLKLAPVVWKHLDAYLFPGNVRELENLIESLYVFAGEVAEEADLPDWLLTPSTQGSTFDWQAHEKQLIQQALAYFGGNKSQACKALGYGSINTLTAKIAGYGLM